MTPTLYTSLSVIIPGGTAAIYHSLLVCKFHSCEIILVYFLSQFCLVIKMLPDLLVLCNHTLKVKTTTTTTTTTTT